MIFYEPLYYIFFIVYFRFGFKKHDIKRPTSMLNHISIPQILTFDYFIDIMFH